MYISIFEYMYNSFGGIGNAIEFATIWDQITTENTF
jgi:hypothetical protein